MEEMAHYLNTVQAAGISGDEFLAIAQRQQPFDLSSYSFLASHPAEATLEGFLFPDTYRVPLDATAPYLVDLMLKTFDERVTPTMRQTYGTNGLTLREAVTLASIVQREAVLLEETLFEAAATIMLVGGGAIDSTATLATPRFLMPKMLAAC